MSPVTDEDLSALADGRLDQSRLNEVRNAISADPTLAARVEQYREQMGGLHSLYDDVLSEPVPQHLLDIVQEVGGGQQAPNRPFAYWRAAAAIAGVFLTGLGSGWLGHNLTKGEPALLGAAVKQAVLAHQMYEVAADSQEGALQTAPEAFAVTADANPFQVPLRVPATVGAGNFVPVGFQTASSAAGPTVQLAYRSPDGKEITLFVEPHSTSRKVPYQITSQDGFDVLYWIDGPLIYVLVGENGEEQLQDLAEAFYSAAAIRPSASSDSSTPISTPAENQ